MFNSKLGQSSFETITLYGWVFLVVTLILAVFYNSGYLNINSYYEATCDFNDDIVCDDFTFRSNDEIRVYLQNELPIDINVISYKFYDDLPCVIVDPAVLPAVFESFKSYYLTFNNCDFSSIDGSAVSKFHVKFNLTYHAVGSSNAYTHNITADIFTQIE